MQSLWAQMVGVHVVHIGTDELKFPSLQECDTRKKYSSFLPFILSIYLLIILSLPSRDIIADSIEAVSQSLGYKQILSIAILQF